MHIVNVIGHEAIGGAAMQSYCVDSRRLVRTERQGESVSTSRWWLPAFLVGLAVTLVVGPGALRVATAAAATTAGPPSGFVSVADFGAKCDGKSDDAPAIQAALDAAKAVYFPAGDYLIKSNLRIHDGNVLQGDPQASRIVVDDTFVKRDGWASGYAAIYNADFGAAYNATTADSVEIRGLRVSMAVHSAATITAIMAFANVKRLVIADCNLICNGTLGGTSGLDVYAGCRNVWIANNSIRTLNGTAHGSALLIRNECIGNGNTTETREVSIVGNHFESNEGDEILNVCGDDGPTEDITVQNNTFHHVRGGTRPVVSIAMYAAGNYAGVPDPPAASLSNVVFDHNTVTIDDFSSDGIRVGYAADTHVVDSVSITNNTVSCAVSAGTTAIIRCEPSTICRNVVVAGNTVASTGMAQVTYGVACVQEVRKNMLTGTIRTGFAYCGAVRENALQGVGQGFGAVDCSLVTGNTFSNVAVGVECERTATYEILENVITPADSASAVAVYGNSLNGAVDPSLVVRGNTINLRNAGSVGTRLEGRGFCGIGDDDWNGVGTYVALPPGALDAVAPSTTQSGAGAAWLRGPVTVVLTASDARSGVKSTEYRLDDGVWTVGSRVPVSGDGAHTLEYRSTDNAGNVEAVRTSCVNIDATGPTTTVSSAPSDRSTTPVTLRFTASDGLSGVATTEYSLNGAWTRGNSCTISQYGTTLCQYRSMDRAGNLEAAKTLTVRIDGSATTTAFAASVKRNRKVCLHYRVDVTPQSRSTARVTLRIYKGRALKQTLPLGIHITNSTLAYRWKCRLARGRYTIKVYAADLIGGLQASVGSSRLVVKQGPCGRRCSRIGR